VTDQTKQKALRVLTNSVMSTFNKDPAPYTPCSLRPYRGSCHSLITHAEYAWQVRPPDPEKLGSRDPAKKAAVGTRPSVRYPPPPIPPCFPPNPQLQRIYSPHTHSLKVRRLHMTHTPLHTVPMFPALFEPPLHSHGGRRAGVRRGALCACPRRAARRRRGVAPGPGPGPAGPADARPP
jgi:hypothetical protein